MKNKKLISFNILIFIAICLTFSINKAYAVTFKDPFSKTTYAVCETANGKLVPECREVLESICKTWARYYISETCCYRNGEFNLGYCRDNCSQGESYSIGELMNETNLRENYYCKANTSIHNSGCYICSNNSSVYKWASDSGWGVADSNCSGGYRRDTSITSESNCKPATPTPTPTATPTPTPESACYICKTNSSIMEWRTNGNADSKCSSGYNKDTTKNQSQCKNVTPTPTPAPTKSCYVCKNDNNIMKWGNSSSADDKCSGGYNKTSTPEKNCVSNPKTGSAAIGIAWFMGILALSYATLYFGSLHKKKC